MQIFRPLQRRICVPGRVHRLSAHEPHKKAPTTPVKGVLSWRSLVYLLPALLLFGALGQTALAAPRGEATAPSTAPTDSTWSNFATFDGPLVDTILTLHTTADGYLWVGTTDGVSVRSPEGKWMAITMDDGLAGYRVTAITTDPTNPRHHWFATNGGASLLDDGGDPLDKRKHQWMTFGKRDGLLDHRLSSVTIAPNGHLWFGQTYLDSEWEIRIGHGISVLDLNGTPFDKTDDHWSSFTAANSHLATDVIHKLATDETGIVWVATQSGLNAYHNGRWQLFSSEQGLPSNEVNTFVVMGHQLWVGTDNGFGLLDYGPSLEENSDDRWVTYTQAAFSVNNIVSLVLDANGYLWVGAYLLRVDDYYYYTQEEGSATLIDFKQTPFNPDDDQIMVINNEQVVAPRAIAVQASGAWFATREGLRQAVTGSAPFDQTQWQWRNNAGGNGLFGSNVPSIAPFSGDRMALTVDGATYILLHGYTPHNLRDDQWFAPQVSSAGTLAADRKNRLWFGVGEGLIVFDPGPRLDDDYDDEIHQYDEMSGLRLDQINEIVIDAANRAWIANGSYFRGGLNVLSVGDSVKAIGDDQMATFTAQNSGLPGKYVTDVALGQNNEVWVGTNVGAARLQYGSSPFNKQDDQWTSYTTRTSGIAENHVRDITVDQTGNVWFALATSGVSVLTTSGEWITFTEADGLIFDAVNAVAADQAGRIWLGTDGEGISVLSYGATVADKSDDQWSAYLPEAPLLSGYIQTLTVDDWGQLWIGTLGGGLSLYSTVEFKQYHMPLIAKAHE